MPLRRRTILIAAIPLLLSTACAHDEPTLYGTWRFAPDESTDLASWRGRVPHLEIRERGDAVVLVHDWRRRGHGAWTDSLAIRPGGDPVETVVDSPIWPGNWFMGVLAKVGSRKTTTARWIEPGRRLATEIEQVVEVSQGEAVVVTSCEYALAPGGDRLILTERRSTRPTPVTLVFDRVESEGRGE